MNSVLPLVDAGLLKGISHITGGGIVGNTSRIMPEGRTMNINWGSWNVLPIFDLIQKIGDISDEEMRKAFNLGIGMILVVSKENADKVLEMLKDDKALVIGDIG